MSEGGEIPQAELGLNSENFKKRVTNAEQHGKYATLHERGVELGDGMIDAIVGQFEVGAKAILQEHGVSAEPIVVSTSEGENVGLVTDNLQGPNTEFKVNFPIPLLNRVGKSDILQGTSGRLDGIVMEIGDPVDNDGVVEQVNCAEYFNATGMEEAIHLLQARGTPGFVKMTEADVELMGKVPRIQRLACNLEVEARQKVDAMRTKQGKTPVWEGMNNKLKQVYPEKYGKPLAEIVG